MKFNQTLGKSKKQKKQNKQREVKIQILVSETQG